MAAGEDSSAVDTKGDSTEDVDGYGSEDKGLFGDCGLVIWAGEEKIGVGRYHRARCEWEEGGVGQVDCGEEDNGEVMKFSSLNFHKDVLR